MGVARVQGALWGAEARDYSEFVEGFFRPAYQRIFEETGMGPGVRLLDIACGPGLAAAIAARRGAEVAGLDAADASIAIARNRTPTGDFRVGDMEELPWADAAFDVVTSFNGFQFAADMNTALREAARVTKPGGHVGMVVWGRAEECDVPGLMAALRELLPPQPPSAPTAPPLSAPGRIESLFQQVGLSPVCAGEVECPMEFPDLEAARRGLLSAGAAVAVIQRVGAEPVHRVLAEALAPFRTRSAGYRLRNILRFAVAAAA
jgi:SAM-dependent methyltransferase